MFVAFLKTTQDIQNNFEELSCKTEAGGRSFVNTKFDVCANVYHNKIRIFYNRTDSLNKNTNKQIKPAYFKDEKTINLV